MLRILLVFLMKVGRKLIDNFEEFGCVGRNYLFYRDL